MPKEPKSPQEKKRLELTRGHFTFGWHSSRAFPKVWKRKKTLVTRELRRKGNDLLAQAKPGIGADDAASITSDVTSSRIGKFIVRKRLRKTGTVTVGEKVKLKLQKRQELTGRRVEKIQADDQFVASAIATLRSLEGKEFEVAVKRASFLRSKSDAHESVRLMLSDDPVDQALHFLNGIFWGINSKMDAVRINRELHTEFIEWIKKADRLLARENRPIERKAEEKLRTEKKLKSLNRDSRKIAGK